MPVRPFQTGDRDAVYDVCVRTGALGADARGHFSRDDLLGDVYAGPYLHLEPQLAFVLDPGNGTAGGYVVGTADTASFVAAYRERWLPLVADRHATRAEAPEAEARLLARLHEPEQMLVPELAAHRAHLHVNLLPEHQGAGHGRALVEALLEALARGGVPSVHLGVAARNTRARAFYARLGFQPVQVAGAEPGTHLWRSTSA